MGALSQQVTQQFHSPSRTAYRNVLIQEYLPQVSLIIRRLSAKLPAHVDRKDLQSAATMGLIAAAERFNPNHGVKFKTFAKKRILGSIADELRGLDWLSRENRITLRQVEVKIAKLEQQLLRAPTDAEIADAMGMSIQKYTKTIERIYSGYVYSLDAASNDGDHECSLADLLVDHEDNNPHFHLSKKQMADSLGAAIEALPPRERLAITLYYYEDLNLKEIGEVMGLTESRVSQLRTQAINRLRKKVTIETVT